MDYTIKESLGKNQEIIELKNFFNRFIKNFRQESLNFYDIWGEFPFINSEKQVNSVVIPAIHKYTENIFLEQPFKKNTNEQRFLDIVTSDFNNIYLIELKHAWHNKKYDVNSKANQEWEKAIKQISDLNYENLNNIFYINNNMFKIAMLVLPTYLRNDTSNDIIQMSAEDYANQLFEQYQNDYDEPYQANLIATWKLENPINYTHEYKNAKEIYPFVSFICKIEKIKAV